MQAEFENTEVEEEDTEFGDQEAGLIEDYGEVGAFDGDGLVVEGYVFVFVPKAEVRFNAHEADDCERT